MTDVKTISIPAQYWEISANLILPDGFDESKRYPTVISAHPIGSCKEQTSGNVYGQALAEQGFVVCVFDASYQGDSGGELRRTENPAQRVADFSLVVDHLETLDFVDTDNIGVLGICGGGGYATAATMVERRIKALVSVTGVNYGRLMQEGLSSYDPVANLERIAEQRTKQDHGGEQNIFDLLPESNEAAKQAGITDVDTLGATDYYRTDRGKAPNGLVSFNQGTLNIAMNWDAFSRVETLLTQPAMIVIGDVPGSFGAYRDGMELYARASRSADRRLVVAEGYSHYELYDRPEPVKIALDQAIPFLREHLHAN